MKHSKTPWVTDKISDTVVIKSAKNVLIAFRQSASEQDVVDFETIVRAVNSHDKLVKAAKMNEYFQCVCRSSKEHPCVRCVAREALRLADEPITG